MLVYFLTYQISRRKKALLVFQQKINMFVLLWDAEKDFL